MGLLDDAIREHLDLKRRRGADPTEIERAEREALGPVRRAPEEGESSGLEIDSRYDGGHEDAVGAGEHGPLPEPDWHEPAATAEHQVSDHEPEADEPEHEPRASVSEPELAEPTTTSEPAAPIRAPDETGEDEFDSWSAEPRREEAGAETVEYDVEDALDAEHSDHAEHREDSDDVLEETPEFLQDTPDHDRLWFEQKPPRDFDFDG